MLAFIEIFYQNRFINIYARKKKAKITDSQSFFVRYKGTAFLKEQKMFTRTSFLLDNFDETNHIKKKRYPQ